MVVAGEGVMVVVGGGVLLRGGVLIIEIGRGGRWNGSGESVDVASIATGG